MSNYGLEGRFPIIESDGFVVAVLLCDNGREHFGLLLHPSNTPVQDPFRKRYNVGYGFRRATLQGPDKAVEQPRLMRLISLGSNLHNMQVNGKTAKATWQDVLITETPPQMHRDDAPSLCSPLHSIAPAPPFRLPPWLVGRLAQLGMEDFGYPSDESLQPSAKLSLFFKGVATALQRLREKIPKQLADESRKICAGVLQKVLMKVAFRNPGLSFTNVLRSLPPDADLDALKALVAPIVDKVSEIKRVEGGRVD